MLLADERGPQDMVDAAVEDDDRRPVDGLAVDDAREIGPGRADQEPPGLQQQAGAAQPFVVGPRRRDPGDAAAEAVEVERVLVRFVRDPEAAARIDQPNG